MSLSLSLNSSLNLDLESESGFCDKILLKNFQIPNSKFQISNSNSNSNFKKMGNKKSTSQTKKKHNKPKPLSKQWPEDNEVKMHKQEKYCYTNEDLIFPIDIDDQFLLDLDQQYNRHDHRFF